MQLLKGETLSSPNDSNTQCTRAISQSTQRTGLRGDSTQRTHSFDLFIFILFKFKALGFMFLYIAHMFY